MAGQKGPRTTKQSPLPDVRIIEFMPEKMEHPFLFTDIRLTVGKPAPADKNLDEWMAHMKAKGVPFVYAVVPGSDRESKPHKVVNITRRYGLWVNHLYDVNLGGKGEGRR